MMYSPNHYKEQNTELIFETIRRFSFATLISQTEEGPQISHLPLLLQNEKQTPFLIGHCARANPHWKELAKSNEVTSIFHGPHAYVSPAWYTDAPDNVPTWNYVSVHVKGVVKIVDQPHEAYEVLKTIVQYYESAYKTNWSLPEHANDELEKLLKAIVAFRIDIQDIQAKFKLSQKQDSTNRENVMAQLPVFMGAEGAAVAEYMKLTAKGPI